MPLRTLINMYLILKHAFFFPEDLKYIIASCGILEYEYKYPALKRITSLNSFIC